MKIAISAESTVDLSKDLLEEYDVHVIPFTVLLGDDARLDGDIIPEEIFTYVDVHGDLPKTSAVNEYQYEEYFKGILKDYDAVIHFSLSSDISSACSNAKAVSAKLKNVYVIDSKSLSSGIGLQCIYASKLVRQNLPIEEIVAKCEARVPSVQASFVLNTVEYLYKGGRCSLLALLGANLLRLKPQIVVREGKMKPGKKYRGKNSIVVSEYCADTIEEFSNPDLEVAFITHSSASQDMVDAAREALTKRGFKHIYETFAGATISSHCGPKCLGILYINDGNDCH